MKDFDTFDKWSLVAYAALLIAAIIASIVIYSNFTGAVAEANKAVAKPYLDKYTEELSANSIMAATNIERMNNGLSPLVADERLIESSCKKLDDMVAGNYWAHISPTNRTPWQFIKEAGYNYRSAGENLAYGQKTVTSLMNAWLESPTHKENILDKRWKDQGVCTKLVNFQNMQVSLTVHHFGSREAK